MKINAIKDLSIYEVYRNYIRRKGKVSRNDPSGNDSSRKANGVVREREEN